MMQFLKINTPTHRTLIIDGRYRIVNCLRKMKL